MEIPEDRCLICGELGHSGCIGTLLEQQEFDRQAAHREFCATLAARDAEIERLKALVEKRERQLVWALRACGDDEALKFYGLDIIAMSDDDAGLLSAIDEAYSSRPDRDQRRHQPD